MDGQEDKLPLDEAALLIAAHADPDLDVPAELRRLDGVATRVARADATAVCRVLFEELGLRGDRAGYDNPQNSYINRVLDRRLGIPISLSLLLIVVARRCGVELEASACPATFWSATRPLPKP